MNNFLIYLLVINIFSFLAYGIDKLKATRGWWRISENFLLLLPVFGGCYGSVFGMNLFRHKTKKLKFNVINYLMIVVWTLGIIWFINNK